MTRPNDGPIRGLIHMAPALIVLWLLIAAGVVAWRWL